MKLSFGQKSLNSAKTISSPNWYHCRLTKYEEKPKKDDASITNIFIGGEVIAPADSEGIQFYTFLCSSKYPDFAIGFVAAILGKDRNDLTPADVADLSEATVVGQELDVYLQQEMYENKPQNKPQDYAPAGKFSGPVPF
jgi:hypothetical protein